MAAKVIFQRILQDSQDFGSDTEHMVSRIYFDLEVNGRTYEGLHVDIKQIAGGDFGTTPLEVGAPHGYRGPFNHEAFRALAERYYRALIGGAGSAIRIGPGATNIRMRNNLIVQRAEAPIELGDAPGGW